ncbi:MAG: ATP cone domain-containing protein, partial [Pseudomonadota bacterium]
ADKIAVAMRKAFIAVEGDNADASSRIRDIVQHTATAIEQAFLRRLPDGGTLHIEDIQDQVELALMRAGEQKVARAYVLYREAHARARDAAGDITRPHPTLNVTLPDGTTRPLDLGRVETLVQDACEGLDGVESAHIVEASLKHLYEGVSVDGVSQALMMTARTLVEKEPHYTYVTARLLQDNLRREALGFLGIAEEATYQEMAELYRPAFEAYVAKGIKFKQLDPRLAEFDLARLGAALDHTRDNAFTYLGLQTLYDRYFIHQDDVRFELPQVMFMRVAMGLALNEENRE